MSISLFRNTGTRETVTLYSQEAIGVGNLSLGPAGGHRARVTYLSEAVGMTVTINGTAVMADTYAALAKKVRTISVVQSAVPYASGIDLVFENGNVVTTSSTTTGAVVTDTTEGADCKLNLNAYLVFDLVADPFTVTHGDLVLALQPAYARQYESADSPMQYYYLSVLTGPTLEVAWDKTTQVVTVTRPDLTPVSDIVDAINNDPEAAYVFYASFSGDGTTTVSNTVGSLSVYVMPPTFGFSVWGMIKDHWYPQFQADFVSAKLNKSITFPFPVGHLDRVFLQVSTFYGVGTVTPRVGLVNGA